MNGVIRTIAGTGNSGFTGDGSASTAAQIQAPVGLATDSTGAVYVTGVAGVANKYDIRSFGVVGYLNFSYGALGTSTAAQTVLITNVGNEELNFTRTALTAGNTGDFAVDPNTTSCNFTVPLASGKSCNVGFTFAPTVVGVRTATFTLLDDTTNGVNTIQVRGIGATTATLTPTSVAFASRAEGTTSSAVAVTLKNTGTGLLTINTGGITITGTGAPSFSKTTTCGATLAAAATCTISVTFTPTVTGSIAATLTVADNAVGGSQTVALSGTATAPAVKPALTPGAVTFSEQKVGKASDAKVITIKNSMAEKMTLSSYAISGADSTAFTEKHGCSSSLKAGASCDISVVFKPKSTGTKAATLTVKTSAGSLKAALGGKSVK